MADASRQYAPAPGGSMLDRGSALDFTAAHAALQPTTKTYHGMVLLTEFGGTQYEVGRLSNWQTSAMTREAKHIYELNKATMGLPVDIVPGKSSGYEVTMSRMEVWNQELELVLGMEQPFRTLMDQRWPVTLYEVLYKGGELYRTWKFPCCWATSWQISENSAEGDMVISVNATFAHLPKVLMPGGSAYKPLQNPNLPTSA